MGIVQLVLDSFLRGKYHQSLLVGVCIYQGWGRGGGEGGACSGYSGTILYVVRRLSVCVCVPMLAATSYIYESSVQYAW